MGRRLIMVGALLIALPAGMCTTSELTCAHKTSDHALAVYMEMPQWYSQNELENRTHVCLAEAFAGG